MSDKNYLQDLFIDEAKPALQRHSGGGGSVSKVIKPLTIGQNGVYDATQGIKDLRFGALNRLRDKLDMKGIEAAANAHEDLTWGEDLYFYSYYGAVPHNTQYREVDIYTIRLDNGIMTIRVYDMISLDTEEVFHVYTYIPAENIEALDVKDGDGWYEVIYDEEDTEVGYARVDAPQVMLIETHDTVRFKEILENFIIEELLSPCDGANPITVEVPERELVDVRITMNGEYDAMYFGHYEDRSNKGIEFTLKEKIDMDALYQYAIEAGYASPGCILCSDDTLGDKITVADAGHWTIICTKSPDTDEERIFTYVYGDEMIALTNVENGEGWYLTRDNGDGTRTFIFSNPPKMEIDYIEDAGFAKFVVEDLIREYGIGKVTVDVPRAYDIKSLIQSRKSDLSHLFYGFGGYSIPDEYMQYDWTKDAYTIRGMFGCCHNLRWVPLFDTSKVTNMADMFYMCHSLTEVPLFDTSKVINMSHMFDDCPDLTEVPLLNTSKVTNMSAMFDRCRSLTEVPLFDTSKVTNMISMLSRCEALVNVPSYDLRSATTLSDMFRNCVALTECRIKNIGAKLQVGSGSTYGHLLTVESLVHMIGELRTKTSSTTFTIGTTNLEKLANVYVRTIEITDEMRAEDDLIDEKLPFEVCESTDEGATLITDYVGFKNWELA